MTTKKKKSTTKKGGKKVTSKKSTTKKKTSKAKKARLQEIKDLEFKLKELKKSFRAGCIRFDSAYSRWSFTWRKDGKQYCKYFLVSKYGDDAKEQAEAYRQKIFPDFVS